MTFNKDNPIKRGMSVQHITKGWTGEVKESTLTWDRRQKKRIPKVLVSWDQGCGHTVDRSWVRLESLKRHGE